MVEIGPVKGHYSPHIEAERSVVMSAVMPAGEDIRRAVQWISDNLATNPEHARMKLIEAAVFKFDLSPLDSEFLINFFSKKHPGPDKRD
jgi:hypothetical protein